MSAEDYITFKRMGLLRRSLISRRHYTTEHLRWEILKQKHGSENAKMEMKLLESKLELAQAKMRYETAKLRSIQSLRDAPTTASSITSSIIAHPLLATSTVTTNVSTTSGDTTGLSSVMDSSSSILGLKAHTQKSSVTTVKTNVMSNRTANSSHVSVLENSKFQHANVYVLSPPSMPAHCSIGKTQMTQPIYSTTIHPIMSTTVTSGMALPAKAVLPTASGPSQTMTLPNRVRVQTRAEMMASTIPVVPKLGTGYKQTTVPRSMAQGVLIKDSPASGGIAIKAATTPTRIFRLRNPVSQVTKATTIGKQQRLTSCVPVTKSYGISELTVRTQNGDLSNLRLSTPVCIVANPSQKKCVLTYSTPSLTTERIAVASSSATTAATTPASKTVLTAAKTTNTTATLAMAPAATSADAKLAAKLSTQPHSKRKLLVPYNKLSLNNVAASPTGGVPRQNHAVGLAIESEGLRQTDQAEIVRQREYTNIYRELGENRGAMARKSPDNNTCTVGTSIVNMEKADIYAQFNLRPPETSKTVQHDDADVNINSSSCEVIQSQAPVALYFSSAPADQGRSSGTCKTLIIQDELLEMFEDVKQRSGFQLSTDIAFIEYILRQEKDIGPAHTDPTTGFRHSRSAVAGVDSDSYSVEQMDPVSQSVDEANQQGPVGSSKDNVAHMSYKRHAPVSLEELTELQNVGKRLRLRYNIGSKIQIGWAVNVLKEWLEEKGFDTNFEYQSAAWINKRLERFYVEVRAEDGKPYSQNALQQFKHRLSWYLTGEPFFRRVNIALDKEFESSNQVLYAVVKNRIEMSADAAIECNLSISKEDFQKMYTSGVLSDRQPITLSRKVWFEVTFFICKVRMPRDYHRNLKKQDLVLKCDQTGVYYTLTENIQQQQKFAPGKMYATPNNPATCPVRTTNLYLQKLCAGCDALFQYPRRAWRQPNDRWYHPLPMGHNRLASMMTTISQVAHLSRVYTNCSVMNNVKVNRHS